MLRQLLLYLSTAEWARSIVKRFGKGAARRFIAGETIAEVLQLTQQLNQQGLWVTIDYLGESITRLSETHHVVETYRNLLTEIHQRGLQAGVSLKLTSLGLDIDESLCLTNLRMIVSLAQEYNLPITIDMESSHYTETTLRFYRTAQDSCNFPLFGVAIQAYLYRTAQDIQELATEGAQVRLCKGAYLESPKVAIPEKADVDSNFIKMTKDFLHSPAPAYLCIATHDDRMIQAAIETIQKDNIPKDRYEFQMLYGIRPARQLELVAQGYPMRVYVPFGEAWYPYFMRRLAERPANVWFILKNLARA